MHIDISKTYSVLLFNIPFDSETASLIIQMNKANLILSSADVDTKGLKELREARSQAKASNMETSGTLEGAKYTLFYTTGEKIKAIREELASKSFQLPMLKEVLEASQTQINPLQYAIKLDSRLGRDLSIVDYYRILFIESEKSYEPHFLDFYQQMEPHLIIATKDFVSQNNTPLLLKAFQAAKTDGQLTKGVFANTRYSVFIVPYKVFVEIAAELPAVSPHINLTRNQNSAPVPTKLLKNLENQELKKEQKNQKEFVILWDNRTYLTQIKSRQIAETLQEFNYSCLITLNDPKGLKHYRDMQIQPVGGEGNCLFLSISDQLERNNLGTYSHLELRTMAVNYIRQNQAAFKQYIETETQTLDDYINNVSKPYVWGGEEEIKALGEVFNIQVVVYDMENDNIHSYNENTSNNKKTSIFLIFKDKVHYDSIAVPSQLLLADARLEKDTVLKDQETGEDWELTKQACQAVLTENLIENSDYYSVNVGEHTQLLLINTTKEQLHNAANKPFINKIADFCYREIIAEFPEYKPNQGAESVAVAKKPSVITSNQNTLNHGAVDNDGLMPHLAESAQKDKQNNDTSLLSSPEDATLHPQKRKIDLEGTQRFKLFRSSPEETMPKKSAEKGKEKVDDNHYQEYDSFFSLPPQ